ncbi:hypothetical protein [Laspinema olomoucense]|uniref:hypothetical protein n=1 Tax=Laspinema olomoucense TaxID=3231600 RepID=UPI0021BB5DDC|nr:hypothetical protein [Laspinema sp. D3a]MCT7989850.1 hypothetical protein [Laspinema sp. D3a]
MKENLKVGFYQAFVLGCVGLLFGGMAGWLSIVFASEVEGIAAIIGKAYWVLGFFLPAVLLYETNENLQKDNRQLYSSLGRAYTVELITGFFGAIAATALFLVPATNLPFILKGLDTVEVRYAIYGQIGWLTFGIVVAITTIMGAIAATWAHGKVNKSAT